MNFFKDPKYKSIRIVLFLVIIIGAGWFTVSNMNQSNSNQGRVFNKEQNTVTGKVDALEELKRLNLINPESSGSDIYLEDGVESDLSGNLLTMSMPNGGGGVSVTCGCPSGCESTNCDIIRASGSTSSLSCVGDCTGDFCGACKWGDIKSAPNSTQ